ncbi:MAG: metabolite traffic protein EboE [Planctomycetes bacterium]|nr:metabolite traffic protein EboE [Planctomycetota bacterium]
MKVRTPRGEVLLSYSTNVHPGESLDDIKSLIANDVAKVRDICSPSDPFGLEVRIGNSAIRDFQANGAVEDFRSFLEDNNFFIFSINGFPLRDFHKPVVKQDVYRPDWGEVERQENTLALGHILAGLLPEGVTGSVSTSPGSFKSWGNAKSLRAELARGFASVLFGLHRIEEETDRQIQLAVEPEPFCTWETVREFADFVQDEASQYTVEAMVDGFDISESAALDILHRYLGINLDTCHLAVEFEDPEQAFKDLETAGINIAKLHVSSAARVRNPGFNIAGVKLLYRLDEPKYLHQTFAVNKLGDVTFRSEDLGEFLNLGTDEMSAFSEVRTHYHMPLYQDTTGPLGTTSDITENVLRLALEKYDRLHVVTETYTWPLIVEGQESVDLHEGIARELEWTRNRLGGVAGNCET